MLHFCKAGNLNPLFIPVRRKRMSYIHGVFSHLINYYTLSPSSIGHFSVNLTNCFQLLAFEKMFICLVLISTFNSRSFNCRVRFANLVSSLYYLLAESTTSWLRWNPTTSIGTFKEINIKVAFKFFPKSFLDCDVSYQTIALEKIF